MAQLHTYIHTYYNHTNVFYKFPHVWLHVRAQHVSERVPIGEKILFLATAVSIVLASQGSRVTHSATKLTNWLRSIASFVCNDFCTYT
jgi:hypothetical protein